MTLVEQVKQKLQQADYLVIGAGAGFSAAAGLTYSGKRFTDNFQPFIARYGMTDMYSAGFYPFPSEEEKWAYWAKHIWVNRFEPKTTALYRQLLALVQDKNYFVITTNADGQFYQAGFDPTRIFRVQGDYSLLQCATACHDELYPNNALVKQWLAHTQDCQIPTALVPKCPVCHGKMAMHLRIDRYFVENADWHTAQRRYSEFLHSAMQGKTVFLELGVGYNTPTIIRYPFEQMTFRNPQATLIRFNRDEPNGFAETAAQTLALTDDPNEILTALLE
ncbi:NAD-dependent SIR2 family protein deacetylase [Cricetibacter osteomyelitidis]|uniref:NAD-dependent SIR2 family protein deacetylase n=1 Tax=Cricetibacter osteomyelitidis TaxID=1521931 RepID=A0A4R2SRP7_9PAST|nr:Sir2 silent information regulator family NAD-dependent deacetylase [Cricetibacter osteomyelitidis]TCP91291.1 NAD-dependent SIR2 family protein deacetylase [Cricetibacter osteomyelitidis]